MSWRQTPCPTRGKMWGDITEDDLSPVLAHIRAAQAQHNNKGGPRTVAADKITWLQLWRLLSDFVSPFEADREMYDTMSNRTILLHPMLWSRLTGEVGVPVSLAGFSLLGFTVTDSVPGEPSAMRREVETRTQNRRRLSHSSSAVNVPPRSPGIGGVTAPGDKDGDRRSVSFETSGDGGPLPHVMDESYQDNESYQRDLEQQVRELQKSLKQLSKSKDNAVLDPQVVGVPPVASTTGGTVVPLQISVLDPDLMPYCISLSMTTERRIVPCTIVDHQYLVFVAPAHPPGSVSVTILCGPGPVLRRYCKSVWLEYRPEESVPPRAPQPVHVERPAAVPLTHHQINQISAMSHIQRPIQSIQDTSEGAGEIDGPGAHETNFTVISNYTSDVGEGDAQEPDADGSLDPDGLDDDGAEEERTSVVAKEETVFSAPLTKDMLELLTRAQNFFLQPVSRMQYAVSGPAASQPLMDDVASLDDRVSYCATNNSVITASHSQTHIFPGSPRITENK